VNGHTRSFAPGDYCQFFALLLLQRAFAVLGQVEEHLHQTLAIGPHHGKIVFHLPLRGHAALAQRRLDHDAQLGQQARNFEFAGVI